MDELVDRLRARIGNDELAGALDVLLVAWAQTPAAAIADAIDAVDALLGGDAITEPPKVWLEAARLATPRERGPLIRGISKRTANDTLLLLRRASDWNDPRLTHVFHELLVAMPWAGRRSREVWDAVFELLTGHDDPRFAAIAEALPKTWTVGGPLQRRMTKQLVAVTRRLRPVTIANEAALVELTGELRRRAPQPAVTEGTLLAAIFAAPDDDALRSVYADMLQERGDLYGEFIALQLRGDPDTSKRERTLVKQHGKRWLGPLAPVLRDVEFRRGFPARATVVFRNQHDAELYGAAVEWATFEEIELDYKSYAGDQWTWSHYVAPTMTQLRIAHNIDVAHLFAASQPWRLERIEVEAARLVPAQIVELARSPLLPRLHSLVVGWSRSPGPPLWLASLPACPRHLLFRGSVGEEVTEWLDLASRSPAETLTLLRCSPGFVTRPREPDIESYRFSRDSTGAFTRLDIEIRPLPGASPMLDALAATLSWLAPGSLTHFNATLEVDGAQVPATSLIAAAASRLVTAPQPLAP